MSYRLDNPDLPSFAELLRKVAHVGIPRVKFTTSHPMNFTSDIIDVIAEEDNVCNFIHLPVQSGSDRVLRRMGREYRRERYLKIIEEIRAKVKDVVISTDIIVGFPGETDDDFERTLEVVAEAAYDSAYTFIYSPRPGTEAAERVDDFVPAEVTRERFERLMEVAQGVSTAQLAKKVGRTIDVLVEDVQPEQQRVTGRSKWDAPDIDGQVIVDDAAGIKPGDMIQVLVTASDEYDLFGRPAAAATSQPLTVAAAL